MATFIGFANGVDTATLPSHQAGDMIVAWAYRDNSATAPSLPSGQNWTNVQSGGGLTNAGRLAAKIATSSSEGVGTFTNARNLTVSVWRPDAGETLSIGVSAQSGGTSDPVAWAGLTLAGPTSWVIGAAGHRNNDTALGTPFTGMVNRSNYIDPSLFTESALHDTDGGVSSWSSGSTNVGGTSSGYRTAVMEMVVTGGGGGTTHSGAMAISGSGAISAAAKLSAKGATVFAGLATQTAQPRLTQPAALAVSGSASIAASGSRKQPGAFAPSGSGALSADGRRRQPGALAASGAASVSAAPTMQMNAAMSPTVTGPSTTFAASITFGGAAAFGGSSAFTATGESTTPEPTPAGNHVIDRRRRRTAVR